ncbi:MAG: hypothetical protein QG552_2490 [Thermodesulfobacteriota bacterium]|nr:hypothetical protein [Thermodesulfobacteriota bacterium]
MSLDQFEPEDTAGFYVGNIIGILSPMIDDDKEFKIDAFLLLQRHFNTLIVLRRLRLAGPVDRECVGQFPSPGKRLKTRRNMQ